MELRKRLVLEGDTLKVGLPGGRVESLTPGSRPKDVALDLLLMFDTTASMYSFLEDVRDGLAKLSDEVLSTITDTNVSIIAFGDHSDEHDSYVVKTLPFAKDFRQIQNFIYSVEQTQGGDAPEAYEDALAAANQLSWHDKSSKVAVLVGDQVPHSPSDCPHHIDANVEADKLVVKGVRIYPVQCENVPQTTRFYAQLAERSGGKHLEFSKGFGPLVDIIIAICMKEVGEIDSYQKELEGRGKLTDEQRRLFLALKSG